MAIDTTGININKIGEMQNAIEEWATAIDKAPITIESKKLNAAIKGTAQAAQLKKLCQACDSYKKTLTVKLRAYKDRLSEVAENYKKNDASSTAISNVTATVKKLKS